MKVLVGLNICVNVAKAIEKGELDLATAQLEPLRTLAAELDNAMFPDARVCVKFVNALGEDLASKNLHAAGRAIDALQTMFAVAAGYQDDSPEQAN